MRPLEQLSIAEASALRGVVFDLDDTLLDHGMLTEPAYRALFRLREAGLVLIACTGRPAGWGEVVQRQWPIDGTIVENGALAWVTSIEGASRRVLSLDPLDREARRKRRGELSAIAEEILDRFPHAALADDNNARVTDVAIDIGEHRRVPAGEVEAMRQLARSRGARTVASSVHLHLSFEPEDKASGTNRFLVERFGEDATALRHRYAFVGDSGNDAAPFAAFALTFGVSNVRAHLRALSVPPRYVADTPMGCGFAAIAARICELRKRASDKGASFRM